MTIQRGKQIDDATDVRVCDVIIHMLLASFTADDVAQPLPGQVLGQVRLTCCRQCGVLTDIQRLLLQVTQDRQP